MHTAAGRSGSALLTALVLSSCLGTDLEVGVGRDFQETGSGDLEGWPFTTDAGDSTSVWVALTTQLSPQRIRIEPSTPSSLFPGAGENASGPTDQPPSLAPLTPTSSRTLQQQRLGIEKPQSWWQSWVLSLRLPAIIVLSVLIGWLGWVYREPIGKRIPWIKAKEHDGT